MTNYRIVCTTQEPASQPPKHAHIVAVGVGTDPARASEKFTLAEVIKKMDNGDTFYTLGVTSGKTAKVEKYYCSHCKQYHIKSSPDAVSDNNLDNLRICKWES